MNIIIELFTETGLIFFLCALLFVACLKVFVLEDQIRQEEKKNK